MDVLCQPLLVLKRWQLDLRFSELSPVSKQIIDRACRERAKIRENLLNGSRFLCVYLRGPQRSHLKRLVFGAYTVSFHISLVRQLNSFLTCWGAEWPPWPLGSGGQEQVWLPVPSVATSVFNGASSFPIKVFLRASSTACWRTAALSPLRSKVDFCTYSPQSRDTGSRDHSPDHLMAAQLKA